VPNASRDITPDTQREYVVRMVNESTEDFSQRYLTNIYRIPAGAEMIVPWEVMVSFCGNPYVVNTARNQEREDVFKRLRVRYGLYDNISDWDVLRPKLACYSIVSGDRLNTVLEDPTGVGVHQSTRTIADDTAMGAQIAALTQQIQALQAQMMIQTPSTITPTPVAPPEARLAPDGLPLDDDTAPTIPLTTSGTVGGVVATPPTPGQQIFDSPPPGAVPLPTTDVASEDVPNRAKISRPQ
jgi:hypothetical protein